MRPACPSLAVVASFLVLASGPAALAQDALAGVVYASEAEAGALTERPLGGVTVVVGRGLMLETGSDGRDAVVAADLASPRIPDHRIGQTNGEGRFCVPIPEGSGPLDVLVWCAGYTPVLRQGAEGASAEFFLTPSASPELHRSLIRPDGRIVLTGLPVDAGVPFVDSASGLLLPLPAGYSPLVAESPIVIHAASDGVAEIAVLRSPAKLDDDALRDLLAEQIADADRGGPRLIRATRTQLDGAWYDVREFESDGRRTCTLYLTRRDTSVILVFAAPAEAYDAALPAFIEMCGAARFRGGSPARPEVRRSARSAAMGVQVGLPDGWDMPAASDVSIRAQRRDPSCTLDVSVVSIPEGGPQAALEAALVGAEVVERGESAWELVAGCPAATRTVVVRLPGDRRARWLALAVALRGEDAVLFRMEGPRYAAQRLAEDVRTVLEAVSFSPPRR